MDLQKEKEAKRNINPSLSRRINDIYISGRRLYSLMRQAAGESYAFKSWDISQEEINRLCGNIMTSDPNESHEGFIREDNTLYKYTHGELFRRVVEIDIPAKTRLIYYYAPFMDAELIRLLEELDLSRLRQRVQDLEYRAEPTTTFAAEWFFEYFKAINELYAYASTQLKN